MDFEKERLMMSKEETRKRAKELLNENQADLITKYMFLEQQCKKQKEVIDRLNFIKNRKNQGASQENINKMAIEFVNSYLNEALECNK